MGYRSDVAIAIPAGTTIPTEIEKFFTTNATSRYRHTSGAALIRFDDIKWYTSTPEIAAVMDWLSDLDSYQFCRIGEDTNDIEESGGWHENPFEINVFRQIVSSTTDCTEISHV